MGQARALSSLVRLCDVDDPQAAAAGIAYGVGRAAGCCPIYVGRLEHGKKNATPESVEKIASAMDVSLSELFDKLGKSGDDGIAAKCYAPVAAKSKAEQVQLYKMLSEMDRYKNQ